VIALLRYQTAALFRSHRWVLPLIAYALLISVGGAGSGSQSVASGLAWSAAVLVPVSALLTRSMLTVEPPAARACVSAATGPGRAQLAALITGLAGAVALGLLGTAYVLITSWGPGPLLVPVLAGLGKALVCALVGSAVGTLFNPPLIRHPAAALLSTITAVIVAWVSSISPANAALHGNGATMQSGAWPAGVPLVAAAMLLAVSWGVSCWLAGRRAD
jgi:hypothetical protein